MAKIKYKTHLAFIDTDCPAEEKPRFSLNNYSPIKVGTLSCRLCIYFKEQELKKYSGTVICLHPKLNPEATNG